MKEPDRLARNAQRLTECYEDFGKRVRKIIAELEAIGYRPRIQAAYDTPEEEAEAFAHGYSKVQHSFHGITGLEGQPASLAVDLLDDDHPLDPTSTYCLSLAIAAAKHHCQTGIQWELPQADRARLRAAINMGNASARVRIGYDPTHLEPSDISLAQALSGARPVEADSYGG
jgi:hypothetical protein